MLDGEVNVRQDTLDSEQRLSGSGPELSASRRADLPDLMERLHFIQVRRASFGVIRSRHTGTGVTCLLGKRWPALVFTDPITVLEENHVERRWKISGGFLMRRHDPDFTPGDFILTLDFTPPLQGRRIQWRATVRVQGYQSKFLGLGAGTPLQVVGRLIGRIYAAYHAAVSRAYLRRLGALLKT